MSTQPTLPSLPPTTTVQDDITKAGQRKVNLIWEYTQSTIALTLLLASVTIFVYQAMHPTLNVQFPPILSNGLFMVLGFYFARTNHAAIGGIGPKPEQEYKGR